MTGTVTGSSRTCPGLPPRTACTAGLDVPDLTELESERELLGIARDHQDERERTNAVNSMLAHLRAGHPTGTTVTIAAEDSFEYAIVGIYDRDGEPLPRDGEPLATRERIDHFVGLLAGAPIPGIDADGDLDVTRQVPQPETPRELIAPTRDKIASETGHVPFPIDTSEVETQMADAGDFDLDPALVEKLTVQHGSVSATAAAVTKTGAFQCLADDLPEITSDAVRRAVKDGITEAAE